MTRYVVVYTGVGFNQDDLTCGPCSQCAIFHRALLEQDHISVTTRDNDPSLDSNHELSFKQDSVPTEWSLMHSIVHAAPFPIQSDVNIVNLAVKEFKRVEQMTLSSLWDVYGLRIASGSIDHLEKVLVESKRYLIIEWLTIVSLSLSRLTLKM